MTGRRLILSRLDRSPPGPDLSIWSHSASLSSCWACSSWSCKVAACTGSAVTPANNGISASQFSWGGFAGVRVRCGNCGGQHVEMWTALADPLGNGWLLGIRG